MRIVRAVLPWAIFLGAAYLAFKYLVPLFRPEPEEMDVQTSVVRRGDLRDVVPADGTVTPSVLVEVKSKASEVVEKVLAEPGDQVEAGQVLVELGKQDITERLKQAQAGLDSAKAQFALTKRSLSPQQKASGEAQVASARIALDNAQAHYDRVAEMHDRGYATDQELDDARTALEQARHNLTQAETQLELDLQGAQPEEIEIAKANLERLQAELDQLSIELGNTTIRAPISGTVLTRPVEVGTAVASGTSGNTGGTVVATIGDLSSLYVKAQIEETDLGRVHTALPCRISFDAYPGWVWRGELRKIYPQGDDGSGGGGGGGSSGVRFPVDISIDLASAAQDGDPGGWRGGRADRGGGSFVISSGPGGMRARRLPEEKKPAPEAAPAEGGGGAAAQPPRLFPQMTASVEIVLEDHSGVLIVPSQYVKYGEDGQTYCEVLKRPEKGKGKGEDHDGAAPGGKGGGGWGGKSGASAKAEKEALRKLPRERRDVELGYSDGVRVEIRSGLEEGDEVYFERPIKKDNF